MSINRKQLSHAVNLLLSLLLIIQVQFVLYGYHNSNALNELNGGSVA